MESSGLFDNVVRVKEKSGDVSLIQNDCDMIDQKPNFKHIQCLSISLKDAVALRKFDENREAELENEMKTAFEYEYIEHNMDLSVVKKIDDDFQYHLQNVQNNDGYKTRNTAEIETSEEEKQEFFGEVAEKLNLNLYCEIVKQNRKRRANEHNLEPHIIDTVHNGASSHTCDICRKNFTTKGNLKIHIDAVHKDIKHTCDMCGKKFTSKSYLNTHIDYVHKDVKHVCDICGKTFSRKNYLQLHINAMHNGIRYKYDLCEKTFAQKGCLKIHIDSVHNGITHLCDVCGKTFNHKGGLKIHSYKEHNSRITI
uniref:C2H2-type domain-containing protein n=1 Tax=Trichogramma kaykai TaxID=54128 RepID=A0ABD2XCP6_9HYME